MKLSEETFEGLAATLELSEHARVILTHNLCVQHGLMNGTQGVVRQIVYPAGTQGPNDTDPTRRMPQAIVVEFPQYVGPVFYSDPQRRTWVPILPRSRHADGDENVTRIQFPLVLGWALTPWKAQGMTLDKAVVHLGAKAGRPGVAFVALSRVRHPDDLLLDDDFPSMAVIQRQRHTVSYVRRQQWERRMRVKFSRTIRRHMRDPELYTAENLWTAEEADVAEELLRVLAQTPTLTDDDLLQSVSDGSAGASDSDAVRSV